MNTFDEIYVLDLHGNSKKKETTPDGSKDENVFDIQQGVAITLAVKKPNSTGASAVVHHADLWGLRQSKYVSLRVSNIDDIAWNELSPDRPFYLFNPQNIDLRQEFDNGWKITEIMPTNSVGIVTARDRLTIQWSSENVLAIVRDFSSLPPETARIKYDLGSDARDWKVELAQKDLKESGIKTSKISPVCYRPFDIRYTYYTGRTRGFICMPRKEVMSHFIKGENIGFHLCRQTSIETWQHILVTDKLTDDCYVSNYNK